MSIYQKWFEAQKRLGPIEKDSVNPHFKNKYFDINTLIAEMKPVLQAVGLIVLQPLTVIDGKTAILTLVVDPETGEKIEHPLYLPESSDPQKMGSAITYYRRYALTSLFFLEAEDDDAQSAVTRQQPKQQPKPQPKPQPAKPAVVGNWREFAMPFGKDRGKKLGDLDTQYISWLHEQRTASPDKSTPNPALDDALSKAVKELAQLEPDIVVDLEE